MPESRQQDAIYNPATHEVIDLRLAKAIWKAFTLLKMTGKETDEKLDAMAKQVTKKGFVDYQALATGSWLPPFQLNTAIIRA